jgi:SM-20-related protein
LRERILITSPLNERLLDELADALVSSGYHILDSVLPVAWVDGLWRELQALPDDALKAAGIGRLDDFQLDRTIRRDKIHWLDGNSAEQKTFLGWMEELRIGLNQRLFLGLADYECHYASYAPGAFYKKHVDAFKSPPNSLQPNRLLSTVVYLNPDWQAGDGGELLIYDEHDTKLLESIAPQYGKLVIFLSEKFPHEVKETIHGRQSIAGWFRTKGSILTE